MKPGVSTSTSERHAERVALVHEARALLRARRVEHATEVLRLVGDHADGAAVDPADPQTMLRAQPVDTSSNSPPSTSVAITSRTS